MKNLSLYLDIARKKCIIVYNDTKQKKEREDIMENRKVYLNHSNNLLQLEEHMYPLVDVEKPNVFRNLFHYDEIPKIAFNDRIVPHCMPDEIWITDTTFRDGQQVRVNFSFTVKKTVMQYINVWKKGTSSRKLQAGFVQIRRILNW